ncbi:SchA/CurD-like domain-containing protein [Sphaerisporangium sp. B11E5]|uniref:SchA/CurD-like domain-containing protein n=1 Tax=Sphaerisporangium sp. B11E5 TaxID=3153563 RepID=UPI00325CDDBC
MQRLAIMFRIKPGTEDKVRDLLANYAPPVRVAADGTRMLSTSVFMKDGIVVRMIEIDGNVPALLAHISQDPSIQYVESELDKYVVEEDKRDASTPDGAREFFRRMAMEHITTRISPREEVQA